MPKKQAIIKSCARMIWNYGRKDLDYPCQACGEVKDTCYGLCKKCLLDSINPKED